MYESKNDFRSYLEQGLYLKHYRTPGAKDLKPRKRKGAGFTPSDSSEHRLPKRDRASNHLQTMMYPNSPTSDSTKISGYHGSTVSGKSIKNGHHTYGAYNDPAQSRKYGQGFTNPASNSNLRGMRTAPNNIAGSVSDLGSVKKSANIAAKKGVAKTAGVVSNDLQAKNNMSRQNAKRVGQAGASALAATAGAVSKAGQLKKYKDKIRYNNTTKRR